MGIKFEVEDINATDFIIKFSDGVSYEYRRKVRNTDVLHREGGLPAAHLVSDDGKVEHNEYRVLGQLHRLDGPAVTPRIAAGGAPAQEAIYAFWGINVPKEWTEPGGLTPENILKEKNADARAMGVRAYGIEKFVDATTDKVLDIDAGVTLTRALIQTKDGSRWMVATDGSTKRVYTLAVPNTTKNCQEAYKALTNNRLDDKDKVAEG